MAVRTHRPSRNGNWSWCSVNEMHPGIERREKMQTSKSISVELSEYVSFLFNSRCFWRRLVFCLDCRNSFPSISWFTVPSCCSIRNSDPARLVNQWLNLSRKKKRNDIAKCLMGTEAILMFCFDVCFSSLNSIVAKSINQNQTPNAKPLQILLSGWLWWVVTMTKFLWLAVTSVFRRRQDKLNFHGFLSCTYVVRFVLL